MDVGKCPPSRAHPICLLMAMILLLASLKAQEPLTIETLAANRALWPRDVRVNVAHEVPLFVNGRVSGSMQASPGRVYPVIGIGPGGVVVNAMGSSLTFPPADTDLLARAEAARTRMLAAARATINPELNRSPAPARTSKGCWRPSRSILRTCEDEARQRADLVQ
jgi:hypothetical protein